MHLSKEENMISRITTSILVAGLLAVLIAAGAPAAPKQPSPPTPKPHKGPIQTDERSGGLSGTVVETMNSGGYTYVCIENAGTKTWVAMPETKVVVGSQMTVNPGQEMTNFTSRTLKRTFDRIIFTGGPVGVKAGPHSGASQAGGSKVAKSRLEKGVKIKKAAGPNACTVSEVFAKRKALNGKTAVVRAKVVKVTPEIMGRNWIHLQDGSGDPAKGTHDLVATSRDLPSAGDIVTIKGKIVKDKDFGAGYKYTVILEEATIQK